MAEAERILGFWADNPPPYVLLGRIDAMIAAWLGVKRQRPGLPRRADAQDPAAFLAELGPGSGFVVGRDVHAGLPKPILDINALRTAAAAGHA